MSAAAMFPAMSDETAAPLDRVTAARRSVILTRAQQHPEGLPPHKYTAGFSKSDALLFWVDASDLGLVKVGETPRGAKLYALPPDACPVCRRRMMIYDKGPCPTHSGDTWAGVE